jgi:hypothetical protein
MARSEARLRGSGGFAGVIPGVQAVTIRLSPPIDARADPLMV